MTAPPDRLAAALADRYRIERELGQGGMATVFLAHDLRHDRKVALKVLKPELAAVLGAERFVAEIRTTAALQHPHILPLFDSGRAEGRRGGEAEAFLYYVMPYVEGETLRDKLNRETQLGVDEAVKITTEVADALDYAHRHGVIHRDIKPENILLHDGRPMVADFGIALALSAAAGGRMTETGLSLGTPHYMSPEQATADKEITGRSDVYSLASVLYEMLTGQPPHLGGSAQQIIMKIVTDTPRPVTELRKSVPPHVAAAVAKALEKLPADRFASAAEFAGAVQGRIAVAGTAGQAAAAPAEAVWRRAALGAGVAALGFAALFAWKLVAGSDDGGDRRPVAFTYRAPGAPFRPHLTISRDGRMIAQAVRDSNGASRLVLRELGSTAHREVPGSSGARDPEFSSDGAWLTYITPGSQLRKIPVSGGPATPLTDSSNGGAWWTEDGWILYTKRGFGLWRIRASGGGPAEQLTTLDTARNEFDHWYPQELPGGKAAIYNSFSIPIERSRIMAVEFATGRVTVLVDGGVYPRYSTSGHLLFAREGALFAVPFDAAGLRVLGPAVPVLEDVAMAVTNGLAGYALSPGGTLAWLKASEWNQQSRVVWTDRAGAEVGTLLEAGQWAEPRLSPDGRWIAVTREDPNRQIWLFDRGRRVITQLTRTSGVSFNPVWTPDSRAIVHTVETPVYDLARTPIDGSASDTIVVTRVDKMASGISPDGRTVAFFETLNLDRVSLAPLGREGAPEPWQSPVQQRNADWSPDGRWMAYEESGDDGVPQVFVRSLDGSGGRHQVSASGGSQPRWTRGGRELVFRRDAEVLAAPFDPVAGQAGAPVMLFRKSDAGRLGNDRTVGYDVTPDGNRFLLVVPIEQPGAQPTVVVLNWLEELRAKLPR